MRSMIDRPINGPVVWHGQELASSTNWRRPLSAAAIAELDAALRLVQQRGGPPPDTPFMTATLRIGGFGVVCSAAWKACRALSRSAAMPPADTDRGPALRR